MVFTLIPKKHINVQMWQQLLESYSSEEAARMIAMDNATENAKEIIKELKLEFNSSWPQLQLRCWKLLVGQKH